MSEKTLNNIKRLYPEFYHYHLYGVGGMARTIKTSDGGIVNRQAKTPVAVV